MAGGTPVSRRDRAPAALFEAALGGDRAATARLLSLIERGGDAAREVGRLAHAAERRGLHGRADRRAGLRQEHAHERADRATCARSISRSPCWPIDPSSPFTGGAILGDRVRMQDHATDPGVFIRSMATRGHLGGLALATPEAIRLLDAVGRRWILVETVGVGQVEVEIAGKADTTVVVVNPGWGDSVQANKAGLMEVADVFVINKADRAGVDETRRDLEQMLDLSDLPRRRRGVRRSCRPWPRPATASPSCGTPSPPPRPRRPRPGVLTERRRVPPRRGAARDRRPPPRASGPVSVCTGERWDELSDDGGRPHRRPVDRRRRDARPRRRLKPRSVCFTIGASASSGADRSGGEEVVELGDDASG